MVVFVLEKVPVSLRGELTRWTLELKAGVFVGTVSAMVRDLLWQKVSNSLRGGGAVMIYNSNTEQGFQVGVNRLDTVRKSVARSCPHARGGEPFGGDGPPGWVKLSPRTWG